MKRMRDDMDGETLAPLVYQPRAPQRIESDKLEARLCRAIAGALDACEDSRDVIAARMSQHLNERFTKTMLDAYASPGREMHRINVRRFIALVHATGDIRLLDVLAEPFGCSVMTAKDVRNAELGLIERRIAALHALKNDLLTRGDAP